MPDVLEGNGYQRQRVERITVASRRVLSSEMSQWGRTRADVHNNHRVRHLFIPEFSQ